MKEWAQKLVTEDMEGFYGNGLDFASRDSLPKTTRIKILSSKHGTDLLRQRKDQDCRRVAIKHAVRVAQDGDLHHQKGDIAALSQGIGSFLHLLLKY